ncbi:MAG: RNA polymerase sigma factor [Sphingobacteriales bacterium]|nr:MAG: RNA polymerase sigma factor [Sphingobacteriales bacterium]
MKANNQDIFITAIKQYEGLIHKVCNLYAYGAEDRKDLFQEIVLQAWTAYKRFNNEAKISTWLYRIALNTAISHLRKGGKGITQVGIPPGDHDPPANNGQAREEEYKVMHRMIGELPPLDKALTLLYLEDRTHAEISEILGISTSNVSTKLARIREKLKKQVTPLFK